MNRGEIWALADGRNVLIISLTGVEEAYGAVLAIVLHDSGRRLYSLPRRCPRC